MRKVKRPIPQIAARPVHWDKNGKEVPCRVTLYPLIVEELERRWKEGKQRKCHWFSSKKAAKLVDEKELAELLRWVANKRKTIAIIEDMRKSA